MEIKEVSSEGLKRKLEISVSSAVILQKADDAIEEATKTAVIPGFRKGHVPFDKLKKLHGEAFINDAKRDYLSEIFDEISKDNKYRLANQPKIDIKEEGENFVYTLEFEVLPDVPSVDLSQISIDIKKPVISDNDIKTEMQTVFDHANQKWTPVTRPAALGDKVLIDYTAKLNKKTVDQKQSEMILGDLPEFDKNLEGLNIGDKVDFDYQYKKDDKEGRLFHYFVEMKNIFESTKYEGIEGDFLKENGFKDLEEFKNLIKQRLEHDANLLFSQKKSDEVIQKLLSFADFDIPESIKASESQYIFQEFMQGKININEELDIKDETGKVDPIKLKDELVKVAESRIKIRFMLNKIGENLNIKVSPKEINKRIKDLQIDPSKENNNLRENIELEIFENKVSEEIEKQITINEQEVDVETFKSWIMPNKTKSEESPKTETK